MAEIDDFDLDRSTARAWAEFQTRLSEVVSMIDDTAPLTIGVESESDEPAPYVRFTSLQRDVVRVEAAGNASLGPRAQLGPAQVAALTRAGWQLSVGDSGFGGFWVEAAQVDSDRLAALATLALRDAYGVPHPVFLAPDQVAEVLQPEPLPVEAAPGEAVIATLNDELTSVLPRTRAHLEDLIDAELASIYGHPPLRDAEGDVAIRVGSTMIFLRTSPDNQEILVFAAVVHDVSGRSRAAEVVNDLNVEARWVKFQLVRDRVFVTISVLARPFVPEHLRHAVRVLSEVADGIDEELAAKLHGRTTFSDRDER